MQINSSNIPNHDKRCSPIMVFRFSTTGSATQCLRSLWRWALTTPTLPSVDAAKGASAESDSSTASASESYTPVQKSTIQGVTQQLTQQPGQNSTTQGVIQQLNVMIWDNAAWFLFLNQCEIKTDPFYLLSSYSWSYHDWFIGAQYSKCSNIPNCLRNLLSKWNSVCSDDIIITWFHFYRY